MGPPGAERTSTSSMTDRSSVYSVVTLTRKAFRLKRAKVRRDLFQIEERSDHRLTAYLRVPNVRSTSLPAP